MNEIAILRNLVAAYATDPKGRIRVYNEAAAELWGRQPDLATDRSCGAWHLYRPDGTPLEHSDCALALSLRDENGAFDPDAVVERPDGTRRLFRSFPSLLRDGAGAITGAINVMVDLTDEDAPSIESEKLAAIVSSSEDAIISKTLDGIITSWNAGATRIFGYEAEEMIGQPILKLIPAELEHEEARFLAALAQGERIEHFDTTRIGKDGRRIDISLTVSPIRDRFGRVVGASKVARDIGERRRSEALQQLLFDELNHRVKNTLAMIQAIASQSLRRATGPEEFVASFSGRVQALARAHDLIVQRRMQGAEMMELVRGQVSLGAPDAGRITCSGPPVLLDARSAVQLALVLHELATNARKHGALAGAAGRLAIAWELHVGSTRELKIDWIESGVSDLKAPVSRGFGSTLIERSLEANGGEVVVHYAAGGLTCRIRLPLPEEEIVEPAGVEAGEREVARQHSTAADFRGKRILLIEDEPLVALEIEDQLQALGCIVVGPAATAERARRLIAEETFDAALVDANLRGKPVDDLVAAITRKGVRFAFATGYGREALPVSFRDAPMLCKPFDARQLAAIVEGLVADDGTVHRLGRKPGGS